ncbi:CocE/NonD family hydrolase [Streptomyces chartreusis]|uniref:CocE/NonD family hydrolase n=1 Tax=Streptomyces chartreusis TaxID=1969 RepID=A0A7H8TM03_STRCX|nr:CocE/NonD family hydrolase [Streptomyces chartreusis]
MPPEDKSARWNGFAPGRTVLAAGSQPAPGGRRLDCDIVCDRDVEVTLRDGTVIYVDVYRPVTDDEVPAILAVGAYGKQGGYWNCDVFPGNAGIAVGTLSGLEKFEGPDPAFWVAHGYAVVNVDARGAFMSEGDIHMFSPQETQDNYDVIEAIAAAEWCSGRIALSGNGWLAVAQWAVAVLRPPHLAAIAPWEGFTDVYRDMICRGGIPGPQFVERVVTNNYGRNAVEDLPAMVAEQPLMSDYWRSKQADAALIDVPAYVVASYTNTLHCRGTLEAFSRLDPQKSWLRVNNTHEWPDLYAYQEDLLRFFDATLKQIDNGWSDTPRVRLSVLDPGGEDVVDRPEAAWPLERAQPTALYLDAAGQSLSTAPLTGSSTGSYEAGSGKLTFTFKVTEDLEIVGPSRLRVWVEAEGSDDIDLYAFVQKLAADGTPLLSETLPDTRVPVATGQLRASHRELDFEKSTLLAPVHTHERERLLKPGEIVALDIDLWPAGIRFRAGEQLQLVISGHDLRSRYLGQAATTTRNKGRHHLHTGGPYDSHLLLPVIP